MYSIARKHLLCNLYTFLLVICILLLLLVSARLSGKKAALADDGTFSVHYFFFLTELLDCILGGGGFFSCRVLDLGLHFAKRTHMAGIAMNNTKAKVTHTGTQLAIWQLHL